MWSPRELLALVEGLPDNGVTAAHMAGGEKWREFLGWGRDRHMIADLWDVKAAHAMKGSKKKPPVFPRPNAHQSEQMTLADFMRTGKNLGGGR